VSYTGQGERGGSGALKNWLSPTIELDTPELKLCNALVFEAVQRVLFEARRPVRSVDWLLDFEWIKSNDRTYPYSFLPLADCLGLNAVEIRWQLYVATARSDPHDAPTYAQGRKRARVVGLIEAA
jgi:hypothetical protein